MTINLGVRQHPAPGHSSLETMTPKDYKLELLAAIESSKDKDALTVTREFMAQKALDDLYENNADGMKRLANS
jgi:hypothetical protein